MDHEFSPMYFPPPKSNVFFEQRNDGYQGRPRAKADQTPTQTEQAGTLPSRRNGETIEELEALGVGDGMGLMVN